jgi:hypothetical protein
MDRRTAITVFTALEEVREHEHPGEGQYNPPTYDVRLDAGSDAPANELCPRSFRVRVTAGREAGGLDEDEWRFVLDLAKEHKLRVDVQNNGIELR